MHTTSWTSTRLRRASGTSKVSSGEARTDTPGKPEAEAPTPPSGACEHGRPWLGAGARDRLANERWRHSTTKFIRCREMDATLHVTTVHTSPCTDHIARFHRWSLVMGVLWDSERLFSGIGCYDPLALNDAGVTSPAAARRLASCLVNPQEPKHRKESN